MSTLQPTPPLATTGEIMSLLEELPSVIQFRENPEENIRLLEEATRMRPGSRISPYMPHILFGVNSVIDLLEELKPKTVVELRSIAETARTAAYIVLKDAGYGENGVLQEFEAKHPEYYTDPLLSDPAHAANSLTSFVVPPFTEITMITGGAVTFLTHNGQPDEIAQREIVGNSTSLSIIAAVPGQLSYDLYRLITPAQGEYCDPAIFEWSDHNRNKLKFIEPVAKQIEEFCQQNTTCGCPARELRDQLGKNVFYKYWKRIIKILIQPNIMVTYKSPLGISYKNN